MHGEDQLRASVLPGGQLAGKQLGRERARGPGGHNLNIRTNFYDEGGQTLEQVTQTGCGFLCLGDTQSLTGKSSERPALVYFLEKGCWTR